MVFLGYIHQPKVMVNPMVSQARQLDPGARARSARSAGAGGGPAGPAGGGSGGMTRDGGLFLSGLYPHDKWMLLNIHECVYVICIYI